MASTELVTRLLRHIGAIHTYEVLDQALRLMVERMDFSIAPRVIGFCGSAGAGKDTASYILSLLGYQKIAFADALKIEVYDQCLNPEPVYKERVQAELDITLPLPLDHAANDHEKIEIINRRKVELRRLLQWHGTEYRRAENENYWIDRVREKIQTGRWVISDVRFQNEIAMVREEKGALWVIVGRDDGYTPTHASETNWRDGSFDVTFDNSGDITELQRHLFSHLFSLAAKSEGV